MPLFLQKQFSSGLQSVGVAGMQAATIRNWIDRGYGFTGTALEAPIVTDDPRLGRTPPIVGGGPGGGILGGIAQETLRWAIDRWMGGSSGALGIQEGEPISDSPWIPNIIEGMFEGTLPRGAVRYIPMPDGTTGCPSGYHPEKQGKGYCVRNRRMNSLNPRALSRASRRVGGFARAVKRARTLKKVCRSL